MNTASLNLPHHIKVLREKLQHPTDYEKAIAYFLEEFAGDINFLSLSQPMDSAPLLAVLKTITARALGPTATLGEGRMFRVPEYGFVHGSAPLTDQVALVIYFEAIDTGAVAYMLGSGMSGPVARFRIQNAYVGGNPMKN